MKRCPILILPGWMLGPSRFLPLEIELKKHGFKTYTIDFPGFEEGEKIIKPWKLENYTTYLQKFLAQKRISQAIFIAHSFGGRVALKLLSEKPELGYRLILTGTPGYRSVNTNRLFAIATISKIGKGIISLPPLSIFEDLARKLFHFLVGAHDLSQVEGFMKQTFINIVEEDLESYMQKISMPTLLLWGADDPLVSVEIAKKMQQTISTAQLVVVPGRRHNFLYREPKVFVIEVMKFLRKVE